MVTHQSPQEINQTAQQSLTWQLLQPLVAKRQPQRGLLLRHRSASEIVFDGGDSSEWVSLNSQPFFGDAPVIARLDALPFEDVAFDLIVLQHLICDGSEQVLAEAMRVLAPGGDLIISGLNCAGLRYHSKRKKPSFPAIKINRVEHLLKSNSFSVTRCLRTGFAGLVWPKPNSFWASTSFPFADRVAIQARHQSGPFASPLSALDKVRSATVSTAVCGAVNSRRSCK